MRRRLSARERVLVAAISLSTGLVSGMGGLLVGAWYGGNYCNGYQFNGVRGYEAVGQIGLAVGALLGCAMGASSASAVMRRGKRL